MVARPREALGMRAAKGSGKPGGDTKVWSFGRSSRSRRRAFRDGLGVDDATWERGRGWALWKALTEVQHGRVHDAGAAQPGWLRMGWRQTAEGIIEDLLADR